MIRTTRSGTRERITVSIYEKALLVLLLGLATFLFTHNLETFPTTWWDEGKFLQIPKNLVQYGKYATRSSDGFRMFSVYGTGPAVLLPITAAFKLFGIGLLQGRAVMAAFSVVTLMAFYLTARRLYTRWIALAAVYLLLLIVYDPFTSVVFLGRQVLGEIPAFGYLMLGSAIWVRLKRDSSPILAGLCGLFWGLSILSKWIFIMIAPCLLVLLIADRVYFHQLRWRHFLIPLSVMALAVGAWFGYMALTLGAEGFGQIISQTQENSTSNVFFISLVSVWSAFKFLAYSRFLVWGLPGTVYVVLLGVSRGRDWDLAHWFLPVLASGWLVWYTFLSLGWSRQAFVPFAISHMFLAKLLYDLAGGFSVWSTRITASLVSNSAEVLRGMAVTAMMLALLVVSPLGILRSMVGEQDRSVQTFTRHLEEQVPEDVVIESYEYELDIFTDHRYHHPPETLVTLATKHVYAGTPYPEEFYDPQACDPAYLIVGPFGKWTEIYSSSFIHQNAELVHTVGHYDLYRMKGYEQ